jgi:catechol 2,3-dioxygenase-like lactoylglutathione lyase family enzyme
MAAPSPRLSETVLKTARFETMLEWYRTLIGLEPFYLRRGAPEAPSWSGAHGIAFFRLYVDYPYTQVFGLFEVPAVGDRATPTKGDPGLHHMQMRFGELGDLFDRYESLKSAGTRPVRSFNHGPGTSFYYEDPDGNTVELSCVNFVQEADYLAYFQTDAYRKNISGIAIDPDEYIARFRSGISQAELVRI